MSSKNTGRYCRCIDNSLHTNSYLNQPSLYTCHISYTYSFIIILFLTRSIKISERDLTFPNMSRRNSRIAGGKGLNHGNDTFSVQQWRKVSPEDTSFVTLKPQCAQHIMGPVSITASRTEFNSVPTVQLQTQPLRQTHDTQMDVIN